MQYSPNINGHVSLIVKKSLVKLELPIRKANIPNAECGLLTRAPAQARIHRSKRFNGLESALLTTASQSLVYNNHGG